jgi:hypothetical protein
MAATAIHADLGEGGETRIPGKRIVMKTLIASFVALGLAGATIGAAGVANAAVGVSFDIGNVAVGYSDGYMGNDHQYHKWAHRSDAQQFRVAHKDQYHTYRHDDRRAGSDR